MTKSKQRVAWLAIILSQLAAVVLIFGDGGLAPVALGDDYPDWVCTTAADPCPTCGPGHMWQCIIVLNGWHWGGCFTPIPFGCQDGQSSCGDDCDCQTPPQLTFLGRCGAVFEICH